jgi:hypothetical protein
MCQTSTLPAAKSSISTTVAAAMDESATIMIRRRFHRSTSAPTNGPSTICGRSATSETVARMVAEPVFCVSHHTRANCTSAEPTSEKACPVQMVKNFAAQRSGTAVVVSSVILSLVISSGPTGRP